MSSYINTKDVLGMQATLDALAEHSLTDFTDEDVLILNTCAFSYQKTLERVTLPNLINIKSSAFADCTSLKEMRIGLEKDTVCTLATATSIPDIPHLWIFVPPDLVTNYRTTAPWSDYPGRIYADGTIIEWTESEINDTDSELLTNIQNGTAAQQYKCGQYKNINFGNLGTIPMQIIAKNMDELSDGSGTAQLTWFPMKLPPEMKHRMNPALSGTTEGTGAIGGWDKSEMKSYLYNTVWNQIPSEWRDVIKEVKKYSQSINANGETENNILTNEKIWIPGSKELRHGRETLGSQYNIAFSTPAAKIRVRNGDVPISWWLRSSYTNASFLGINHFGKLVYDAANSELYVAFGFCT